MARERPSLPTQREPCDLPSVQSSASFWHRDPSALLLAHRSTRHLPATADVVIIGSGMTGTSAAYHLLRNDTTGSPHTGLDVVMLEAREACWGATGRNGGHCQPILFEHPQDPSIGHFELANFRALEKLIADEKSIDCEFVRQPGVRAIYSRKHLDDAELALHAIGQTAPELASMMRLVTNRDELNRLRIPTALAAVVTSLAARMWPYKFVSHILEELLTAPRLSDGSSFNLQTLTPVTKLRLDSTTSDTFIETARGSIRAKNVILATNAYTSHLLPTFSDLIVPCRGQMSALVPFPSLSGPSRLQTSLGFLGDGLDDYLIQRPDATGGHLMFGGGRQHGPSIGVTDDSVVDDKTSHYLRSRLVEVFNLPEGGEAANATHPVEMDATHLWTGIMGFSRDDKPWVGALPSHPNVYISAGYTGHGMPNTWLCGKTVATAAAQTLYGEDAAQAMERASAETGLPRSYRITADRMREARLTEAVEIKDWAEMDRGRHQGKPASGYA